MLEALFTSWILREQRKSSHNSVSDNNRGGKINNYAYLFFLDLLLAWRAYKAAWCISSLLYLPDKKLCCPFLFFRTCDTLCDENWKVAKKFVFSNNFAVISNLLIKMTSIFKAFFLHFFLLTKWQKWVTRTFLFFFSAAGIDCFKCVSVNGSNPACEDPFHNNHSSNILERPCMGGRKGRNGLFPASACIKLSGTYCKNFDFDFIFVVVACFQI